MISLQDFMSICPHRNKSNKIQDEADQIKLHVCCNVTETSKTKIHEHIICIQLLVALYP